MERMREDVRVWMEMLVWIWIIGGLGLTLGDGITFSRTPPAWDNETGGQENRQGHVGRGSQGVVTLLRDSNAVVFKAGRSRGSEECPGIKLDPLNEPKGRFEESLICYYYLRICIEDRHICLDHSSYGPEVRDHWRVMYHYEGGSGRCGKEGKYYTHPTIYRNGKAMIDLLLRCMLKGTVRTHYCAKSSIFEYRHGLYDTIKSYGIPEEKFCPSYCIGSVKLTKKSNTFLWEIDTRCPKEDIDPKECTKIVSSYYPFVGIGDNKWCYNSTHYDAIEAYHPSNLTATVTWYEENGQIKAASFKFTRRCGAWICHIGYCLRKGKEIMCGNEGKHFNPNDESDPRRDCFFKTADWSSLRLSETEWCCRDPNGCATPVGKCTQQSDCFADYCISHGETTQCPSEEEAQWSECMNITWGETLRIPRRGIWCCVPAHYKVGCNLEIRACGSNLSCLGAFCIGKEAFGKIETKCPDAEDASADECKGLTEDQELRLSTQKVCCKKVECHGKVIVCGNDRSCADHFCLAEFDFQGENNVTKCPSRDLDDVIRHKCSALSEFQTISIDERSWCCKAEKCNTLVATSATVMEPESTTRMRKERETKSQRGLDDENPDGFQILFWILIAANLFVVVFGGGGLVAYYLHLKRKRKERDLRRAEDSDKASDQLTVEIEEALQVELEKKPNTQESSSQEKISTNKTTSVSPSTVPAPEETEGTTDLSHTQSLSSFSPNGSP